MAAKTQQNQVLKEAVKEVRDSFANIRKQEWPDQLAAIEALAKSADPLAEVVLFQLLDVRKPEVRSTAMNALADRSEALGRTAARALLEDTNAVVRDEAATILGVFGNRQDVRRLRRALLDEYWVMRATVADSLGQIGGKAAHPLLLHTLRHDPHPVVRRDTAYALTYARSPEVVPQLEKALDTEQVEQARQGLLSALVRLGQRERLPELLALLTSEDCTVRHATINILPDCIDIADRALAIATLRTALETEEYPGIKGDGERTIEKISARTGTQ